MRKKIITLILCISAGVSAQENWGPAQPFLRESWLYYCPSGWGYGPFSPSMATNDSIYFQCVMCIDAVQVAYAGFTDGGWRWLGLVPEDIVGEWTRDIFFQTCDSTLFFTHSDLESNQDDIYSTQLINDQWMPRQSIGSVINTTNNESSPSLPADGSKLYFLRAEEIMCSEIVNGQFTEPFVLPDVINSPQEESNPRISPDGGRLYFNRWDGVIHNSSPLYASNFNGEWQEPVRLNANINSEGRVPGCELIPPGDCSPTFSYSGTRMYFTHFEPVPPWCEPFTGTMVSNLVTGVDEQNPSLPGEISLSAYPNPFNASVNLAVTGVTDCIIHVYDIAGRGIAEIGIHGGTATWDASNYSSGIYFVRATAENKASRAIKLVYLK